MGDFLLNTSANLVGTFAGAVLAIATTWWFEKRGQRQSQVAHLQRVVDRLHRSRALAPDRSRVEGPLSELEAKDVDRCNLSVLEARARIATASEVLRSNSVVASELDGMYVDCLRYLETVEGDREQYLSHLRMLREGLDRRVAKISRVLPAVDYREPGTAHLQQRADLD